MFCHAKTPLRGFTLLEVMVAMVILSTILSFLYTSFFQISSGVQSITEEMTVRQELRLLLQLMARDLGSARYLETYAKEKAVQSGLKSRREYVGGEGFSTVSFHAAAPSRIYRNQVQGADPGLHELSYTVDVDEDDRDIGVLFRREDFYLDTDMERGGETVALLHDVKVFKIEYLPLTDSLSETEQDWLDEWDSSNKSPEKRLPRALRITLARADRQGKILSETLEVNLLSALRMKK